MKKDKGSMPRETGNKAKKANAKMEKVRGNAAKKVAPPFKSTDDMIAFRKKKYGC